MTSQSNVNSQSNSVVSQILKNTPYVDATEDAPGDYGNPLILNKIFDLLVIMIEMLQKTAAAQANRLNFLTAWQQAYTAEENEIHAFVGDNGDEQGLYNYQNGSLGFTVSSTNSSAASTVRQDLNTTNTNYTQQMQGNNGVISNDSKALQSVVNQTNDEVQSQTDMATAILQQLSTILTSIYQAAT